METHHAVHRYQPPELIEFKSWQSLVQGESEHGPCTSADEHEECPGLEV